MCFSHTERRKPTTRHHDEPEPVITLEHLAQDQYSATGELARQLLALRKRVEELERYAGDGLT